VPYPIFPSLSRAPSFQSTRKIEDGTLKDPMESGYVATRPRFTRLRRTFGVSYKFLSAEDVRALDVFESQTVQGGAGAFYLPNLLPNGSFELLDQSTGQLQGWSVDPAGIGAGALFSCLPSTQAHDGSTAIQFNSVAGSIAAHGSSLVTRLLCSQPLNVTAGDVYQIEGWLDGVTTLAAGLTATFYFGVTVVYEDGTVSLNGREYTNAPTPSGYLAISDTFTVQPSAGGATQATIEASLNVQITSSNGSSTDVGAGQAVFTVDSVGMALIGSAQPNGRMPGLNPLLNAVRFTEGLQISDAGIANGQKTYNVSFEVTEV